MVSIEDRLIIDNTELLTYYHHAIFNGIEANEMEVTHGL